MSKRRDPVAFALGALAIIFAIIGVINALTGFPGVP